MTVKEAKERIEQISDAIEAIDKFDIKHKELDEETNFISNTIGFLIEYRKILDYAIEKANLNI